MSDSTYGTVRHEVLVDLPHERALWTFADLNLGVHRHIERHGAGWQSLRDGLEAPEGWPLYLARFEALTQDGQVSA
jgi:hypothetical protein